MTTDPYPRFKGQRPTPVRTRSGMRVGWETYATRAEAEKVSAHEKLRGEWYQRRGSDFGLVVIGEIVETVDGMFEVTVP